MDETSGAGRPTLGPGWLDDPFHRSGQRWWDGRQWTARTRSLPGDPSGPRRSPGRQPRSTVQEPTPAGGDEASSALSRRFRPPWSSYTSILVGVFLVFAIVGLVAPSAEESAAFSDGYPRAAYWSCADLLSQRLGPSVDLEFPGDSMATIAHEGQTWDVSGRVDIISDQQPVARTWRCTVTHEDGVWSGIAELE